jgi:hypothetical protein
MQPVRAERVLTESGWIELHQARRCHLFARRPLWLRVTYATPPRGRRRRFRLYAARPDWDSPMSRLFVSSNWKLTMPGSSLQAVAHMGALPHLVHGLHQHGNAAAQALAAKAR